MSRTDDHDRGEDETILAVEDLSKHFPVDSGFIASLRGTEYVRAVDDVDLDIKAGETLALVGESGCGKTTLARAILQLERPTSGSVRFNGTDLTELSSRKIRPLRRDMQMIFQDPQSSLNPRMEVGKIIEEPMKAHGMYDKEGRRRRAQELLDKVGLDAGHYYRYPHEFSGGQRQRVNLARALSTDPDLVMCDEPVSALDVTIQAQVLNTMMELQEEFDVTYVFISHDLSVVRYIADRVAVMYLGHLVELAEKEELFENPQHPYTQALLDAIPVPDPK
ncbi:MAG: ABC transporter ATP-binding protein, partial [Halobacteriota archaeon]